MRPFDLAFLEAIGGRGECHVLHAHGERLYFDRLVDYPVHALSWADLNGGPSIAEARRRTPFTLMTGLDHARFAQGPAPRAPAGVPAPPAAGRQTRLIPAPRPSPPTHAYPPPLPAAPQDSANT